MPITPRQLMTRRKSVEFPFADETVHLEYYPFALNGESLTEVQDIYRRLDVARQDESTTEEQAEALLLELGGWVARVFAAWDYLEDDPALGPVGEPIPITAERIVFEMKRLADFILACISAIGKDYSAGKVSEAASSERSGATSSQTERSTSSTAKRSRRKSP